MDRKPSSRGAAPGTASTRKRVDAANLLNALDAARFASGRACPHCRSPRLQRWGVRDGRQRRRCITCKRTFSDFTLTRFAYHKRIDRVTAYCHAMLRGETVRAAAAACGVHPTTSFRWRHLLLGHLLEVATPVPRGVAEAHELHFFYSEKGSRQLNRPAISRGVRGYGADRERYWVLLLRDRSGTTHAATTHFRRPGVRQLEQLLTPPPAGITELIAAAGPFSPYAVFCRRHSVVFNSTRVDRDSRQPSLQNSPPIPLANVRNAVAAAARLRFWMKRFRGVASRYLDNYLRWHSLADEENRTAAERAHARVVRRRRWVRRPPSLTYRLREQSPTTFSPHTVAGGDDIKLGQRPP
jgi:transposase-like protein